MSARAGSLVVSVAISALVLIVDASPGAAQERCALRITAPTRSSVGTPGGDGAYTTYLGGGTVTLRCGGAVMSGDSAVHFETEQRAEMIGSVDYRDTTRTLSAERLIYYEANGQVVASGDVELLRLATGARLRGPQVTFFRAGAGGGVGRTLATDRPRMTIPPEGGPGPPIEVDADVAEFIGDTLAFARGDVVIGRIDFDASADSAWFGGEMARLYGHAVVSARRMRIEGDSIQVLLASGGVDRLHAFGGARGTGEAVELEAEEILIRWLAVADEVDRIEAYRGRALAAAETFLVAADSLDMRFTDGGLDSLTAVGRARSLQLEDGPSRQADEPALREPELALSEDVNWIEGDTIRAWFEPGGEARPAADGPPPGAATEIRRLLAIGNARSFSTVVRDSARSERPSRNYMIGRTIELRFLDGEPVAVTAEQAIGVFLEPSEGPGPSSALPPPGGEENP